MVTSLRIKSRSFFKVRSTTSHDLVMEDEVWSFYLEFLPIPIRRFESRDEMLT